MTERVRLAAGGLALDLAPAVGGSVAAFALDGEPLMRAAPDGSADVLEIAAFPLVPYSNRIRDGRFMFRGREVVLPPNLPPQKHPLHGTGWRAAWTVALASGSGAELAYEHVPDAWPWAFRARQRFALDSGGLSWRLECENASDGPMPCGLGWHPYFPSNAETVLSLDVDAVWTVDAEIMPVALEPAAGRYGLRERRIDRAGLDNGYEGWGGRAEIRWPDRGLRLTMTSPGVSRFQVYSPDFGGLFCAEPVTHANAAPNRPETEWAAHGLRVLESGEAFALDVRLDAERT